MYKFYLIKTFIMENKKLKENLIKEWFSEEQIDDIVVWLEDIKKWKVYTAEEVHKYLFQKEPVHV